MVCLESLCQGVTCPLFFIALQCLEARLRTDKGAQLFAEVSAVNCYHGTFRALKNRGQVTLCVPLSIPLFVLQQCYGPLRFGGEQV